MQVDAAMEWVVIAFEVAGIAILALGSLRALGVATIAVLRGTTTGVYERASASRSARPSSWASRS